MRKFLCGLAVGTALMWLACGAQAGIIINTIPDNDRANLNVDAGQSFTTGILGAANRLRTIEIKGSRDNPGNTGNLGPFVLALYNDVDQDPNTFDRGSLLGTSTAGTMIVGNGMAQTGGITPFTFNNMPSLLNNRVYSFRFESETGDPVGVRVGMTNGANSAAGGQGAPPLTNGAVFHGGVTAFGNAFDIAMRVSTVVPEPTSLALGAFGLFAAVVLRRGRN